MMTLSKQKRGNWAEYIYQEKAHAHGPSDALVEGFSADGTYIEGDDKLFNGGRRKGRIYELKCTNVLDGVEDGTVRFSANNIHLTWMDDGYLVMGLIMPDRIMFRRGRTRTLPIKPPDLDLDTLWLPDIEGDH